MNYLYALGTIAALSGLGAWAGYRRRPAAFMPPVDTTQKPALAQIEGLLRDYVATGKLMAPERRSLLIGMLQASPELKKTLAAVKADKALPADEIWPGTNMSVSAKIAAQGAPMQGWH